MFIDANTGKMKINGEVGTPAWYTKSNNLQLTRIADSLERIAKCLENNNQSSR